MFVMKTSAVAARRAKASWASRATQIQHDVALVAVQAEKGRPLPVALGPQVAALVAVVGLDLDDVRAEISRAGSPP